MGLENAFDAINGEFNKFLEKFDLLYCIIIFTWIVYAWETYLSQRQCRILKTVHTVPKELENIIDQESYTKARLYNFDRSNFNFWSSLISQITTSVMLWFYFYRYLWTLSERTTDNFGYNPKNEFLNIISCSVYYSLISLVLSLPWSLYSVFVIEERHGFNKQTLGFFFKDTFKKLIVSLLLLIPISLLLIYIIKIGGTYFFLYAWLFCALTTVVLMSVYMEYIAPLFDKFTALPEGHLRSQIEALAHSIHFPLTKLYIVEGSKRSSHSNAYFYGFFNNKRIVLFDTLLEESLLKAQEVQTNKDADKKDGNKDNKEDSDKIQKDEEKNECASKSRKVGCNVEEVLAILGHELGHWKLNHVLKNIIISQVNLFFMFMLFALFSSNQLLYDSFGFTTSRPTSIGLLIIFQFLLSPYQEVCAFLMTMLSRRYEFQADFFAVSLNRGVMLKQALVKLNKDNLSFPVTDPLYSLFNFSHPPLLERLAAIDEAMSNKKKD